MEIRDFLKEEFAALLSRRNIREEIESALLEEGRLDIVLNRIKSVAKKLE